MNGKSIAEPSDFSALRSTPRSLVHFPEEIGRIALYSGTLLKHVFTPPFYVRETIRQMHYIGVMGLWPLILMASGFGVSMIIIGIAGAQALGIAKYVGGLTLSILMGDGSIVLTGSILAGRAGCAIAAQIGTMRASEEVDALEVMGIHPVKYLGVPCFVAFFVMSVLYTYIGVAIVIGLGLFLTVTVKGLTTAGDFMDGLTLMIKPGDFYLVGIKAMIIGFALGVATVYCGFTSKPGAEGVGEASNKSINYSYLIGLIILFLFDLFVYG
ncbi:MAG: ABC transporter permease [Nitrospirae bacterium]|nr:ABC transporter permease [Nitrospirota bacterium]